MASPEKKQNLSREDQLRIGLEYTALAYEYTLRRRKEPGRPSLSRVIQLLEDLRNPDYLGAAAIAGGETFEETVSNEDRKYRNYIKRVQALVPEFEADFQRGIVQKFKEKKSQHAYLSFYLRDLCFAYSEEALELYLRNLDDVSQGLFRAVVLKYSMIHKLRLIFNYASIDGSGVSRREVIPLALAARRQYLDLIALEIKQDGKEQMIKQFALSGVQNIESDLFETFYDPNRVESKIRFDFQDYSQNDPAARFGRKKVKFRLLLKDSRFQHFRQSYALDYTLAARRGEDVEIEINTHDHRLVYSIVFDYGEACRLLEPEFAVNFLKGKFKALAQAYGN